MTQPWHALILMLVLLVTATAAPVTAGQGGVQAGESINLYAAPGGVAVIQTGDGTFIIKNFQGIDPEVHEALSKKYGVTESAIKSFFKILEQKDIPLEDLDSKLRESATLHKQLQAQLQRLLPDDPAVMALREEARQALEAGNFAQVETLLRQAQERDLQAIQEQQSSLGKRQLSAAATSAELGALKRIQRSYAEGAIHYRQAATVVPRDEVLTQAGYLYDEGAAWIDAGQYSTAQPPLKHALAIREKVLGPDHPDVATSLNILAVSYHAQRQYAEAQPRYERALAIQEKVLGPDHPDVALILSNLALIYYAQRQYAEAESLLTRARAIEEKVLGPDHPRITSSLGNLAELYYAQGRYTEAEPLFTRALAIGEKTLGPEHPNFHTILKNYLGQLQATNRQAEAEQLIARIQAARSPRGWLGLQLKPHDAALGILVERVITDSPAARAGFRQGDVITHCQGHLVQDVAAFVSGVAALAPGTIVDCEVMRNSQHRTLQATLGTRPVSAR